MGGNSKDDSGVVKELPSSSRYRVARCIAKGRMGAVYIGVQRGAAGFERPVAIKRTHAHLLEDARTRTLILEEAQHASLVRHPNVVSIDDVEDIDGELLLIMDFIEGGSLSQLIARAEKIPLRIALRVALDACLGLGAIHSARDKQGKRLNLVHRDISPQNILVGFDGLARITDFGIAKRIGSPSRTSKNMRRGKCAYMAPEYILTSYFGPQADLFALGVVLWEMLAGSRLFGGQSDIDTVRRAMIAEVPSLEPLGIPRALDRVIAKSLAREAEDRYATMREFADALEAVCAGSIASADEVATFVDHVVRGEDSKDEDVSAYVTEELNSSDLIDDDVDSAGAANVHNANDKKRSRVQLRGEADSESHPESSPNDVPTSQVSASTWLKQQALASEPPVAKQRGAHKAFRLEDKLAGNVEPQPSIAPVREISTAPCNMHKTGAPPKRDSKKAMLAVVSPRAVGLAIFFIAVVSFTTALAYASTDDSPHDSSHSVNR